MVLLLKGLLVDVHTELDEVCPDRVDATVVKVRRVHTEALRDLIELVGGW